MLNLKLTQVFSLDMTSFLVVALFIKIVLDRRGTTTLFFIIDETTCILVITSGKQACTQYHYTFLFRPNQHTAGSTSYS